MQIGPGSPRERELSFPQTSQRIPLQSRRRRCLLLRSLLSLSLTVPQSSLSLSLIHPLSAALPPLVTRVLSEIFRWIKPPVDTAATSGKDVNCVLPVYFPYFFPLNPNVTCASMTTQVAHSSRYRKQMRNYDRMNHLHSTFVRNLSHFSVRLRSHRRPHGHTISTK